MGRAEQVRGADAVAPRSSQLAAILLGCARADAGAAQALRGWESGRLAQLLARTLGDPLQAEAALDRLIADLSSAPGAFAGGDDAAAQDWLFARMRLAARKAAGDGRPIPKLYAVPARPTAAEDPPAGAVSPIPEPAGQWHVEPTSDMRPEDRPDFANARLRRPNASVQASKITVVPAPGDPTSHGRGWLRTLLLLVLAGLFGSGLAMLGLLWLSPERPPAVTEQRSASEAVTTPSPPPATPQPTKVSPTTGRDLVGPPIEAREPPVLAAPMERPATTPAPVPAPSEKPATPSPRIVVHHNGIEESAVVAEQLASQLLAAGFGQVEVRAVTFDVATASIRYFHDEDRARAERLVAAIGPFLSWHGRAAPSTPISFTDYRPLPRRGTLEIWLPRR